MTFVALIVGLGAIGGLNAARIRSLDAAAWEAITVPDGGAIEVRIPPRRMGEILSDFPEFAVAARGASVTVVDTTPATCRVWIGAGCYRFTPEETRSDVFTRAPRLGACAVRPECGDVAALVPADGPTVEVPWIDREFGVVSCARPIVGLFTCVNPG